MHPIVERKGAEVGDDGGERKEDGLSSSLHHPRMHSAASVVGSSAYLGAP